MLLTGSLHIDAERAFRRAARGRRLAVLTRQLRCLEVVDERCLRPRRRPPGREVIEIPVTAIRATLEPSRAAQFDRRFRPARIARPRWERLWMAEQSGARLPPVEVVPIGDAYALRDGHHRVSVAIARGAMTIDARIGPAFVA